MDRLKPSNKNNARLLFVDDFSQCDICDETDLCAHIDNIGGLYVSVICIICLKEMIKQMEEV